MKVRFEANKFPEVMTSSFYLKNFFLIFGSTGKSKNRFLAKKSNIFPTVKWQIRGKKKKTRRCYLMNLVVNVCTKFQNDWFSRFGWRVFTDFENMSCGKIAVKFCTLKIQSFLCLLTWNHQCQARKVLSFHLQHLVHLFAVAYVAFLPLCSQY